VKSKAERIFDAFVGLLLAAVCTVIFVSRLSGRLLWDPDTMVFLFVACGVGAGVGLYFVYRLVPQRVQSSLFADSRVVLLQPGALDTIPAKPAELPAEDAVAAVVIPAAKTQELIKTEALIRNSNRRETIPRYKMREGIGALGLVVVVGLASALPARVGIGWGFLWLGIAGGGAVALVLGRWNQASSIASYTIPVAGGIVGVLVMLGVGVVMARFHFLRDFLALAVAGGIAFALFLRWGRSRHDSSRSLIQPMTDVPASHVTMQIE
jgi:hypothetical protein